jgi:AraC-like DNA-binding protein
MKIDLLGAAVCRSIRSASTLNQALETFIWHVSRETTAFECVITPSGLNVRICRKRVGHLRSGVKVYTDLDFFIDLASIIREFAGRLWFPRCIAFQHWPPIGMPRLYFPNARLLFDQEKSWIELPRSLLKLSKRSSPQSNGRGYGLTRLRHLAQKDTTAFMYGLKRTLRENASEGFPDIAEAATIMCTSVRTLQRALSRAGVTYSKIVEYARFEAAAEMLTNPELKIIDIAYALGYEDPSHFARAFRRVAGSSPRDFRLKQLPGVSSAKGISSKTSREQ